MYDKWTAEVAVDSELSQRRADWNRSIAVVSSVVLAALLFVHILAIPASCPETGQEGGRCSEIPGKLDLNRATWFELGQLPGVGEGLARRIVEYRTLAGRPLLVRDLIAVKGIGSRTLQRIGPYLSVRRVREQPS